MYSVILKLVHTKFCFLFVVYYETIKGELNKKLIYECRCDERLKHKTERSTHLGYTVLRGGLEHLKIGTRLLNERFGCKNLGSVFFLLP